MSETYAPQPRPGHSTGPRTENGKAISSRNSTTHGCCSKQAIIQGESEEEFNQLLEDWLLDYQPEDSVQRSFVEQAVHAQWVLRRNTNRYNEFEQSLEAKSVLEWTEEDHKKFERFTRYKTTAERAFTRAFTQLEQLCKRIEREQKRERQATPAAVKPAPLVLTAPSEETHAVVAGHDLCTAFAELHPEFGVRYMAGEEPICHIGEGCLHGR